MDKKIAIRRMEQSRAAFLKVLQGLDEAQLDGPAVEGVWTIKDVAGHIAAWDITLLQPMRSFAVGGPFNPANVKDTEAFNRIEAARRKSWSVKETLAEMEGVRQELMTLLSRLSEEQCTRPVTAPWGKQSPLAEICVSRAEHEEEHVNGIRALVTKSLKQ